MVYPMKNKRPGFSKYQGKRKPQASQIAQQALKMAKANRSFASTLYTLLDTMTGSKIPEVTYIQPPDNAGGGEKQTIQEIEFNLIVKMGAGDSNWRVDIVLDRMPSKATLSLADVYDDNTPECTALMSFDNRERYKICKSYQGFLSLTENNTHQILKFSVPSGLVAEADGTVFNQSNILKNAYYLVYWADAVTGFPVIQGDYRISSLIT